MRLRELSLAADRKTFGRARVAHQFRRSPITQLDFFNHGFTWCNDVVRAFEHKWFDAFGHRYCRFCTPPLRSKVIKQISVEIRARQSCCDKRRRQFDEIASRCNNLVDSGVLEHPREPARPADNLIREARPINGGVPRVRHEQLAGHMEIVDG